MNKNLLILGAGGHGRVVKKTALAMGYFDQIDFLDDHADLAIGKCEDYKQYIDQYTYGFVGFGDYDMRMKWMLRLKEVGYQIPALIHPTAYKSTSAKIAEGSIVCANAVVNANSSVQEGCIVSIGVLIDHDCLIGQYSHINTGAIVKAGYRVEPFQRLEAGIVYSGKKRLEGYSFEVGM